ncbi:aminoglycoside 6-adenylyltransferase [Mesorhizobium sp. 1M-11]|uniref:aminoglycoside 6-adenylyltransferase n=1 Tax=Mesorhizobium sp. 1M-11 TaxID=1529006 RepID=UPI0006C74E22|nr:aminoglycoside 6-adenylyltransferase [Mesorhizobium sp. 1M-11]
MTRTDVLNAVVAWATGHEGVEALIHTGSLVRTDNRADEFSDLDIEIIAARPDNLSSNDKWLTEIGELITVLRLDEDQDWPTRLAIFEGGVKVDFTIAGLRRVADMIRSGLDPLYERGYRILLDKTGLTKDLPPPSHQFPAAPLPSSEKFRERVEEFWFEAFHVPKYLARGELFLVKQRDWTMKELLLEMIEWHAIATNSKPVDIWHIGTHLREWTDTETWRDLQETFGRFDADDQKRAFEETVKLYGRLGREVAARAGFHYPQQVEDKIRALG